MSGTALGAGALPLLTIPVVPVIVQHSEKHSIKYRVLQHAYHD